MLTVTQAKMKLLEKRLGPLHCRTKEEALDMSIHLEMVCKDIGVFDPAYRHYSELRDSWFKAACLLEETA